MLLIFCKDVSSCVSFVKSIISMFGELGRDDLPFVRVDAIVKMSISTTKFTLNVTDQY